MVDLKGLIMSGLSGDGLGMGWAYPHRLGLTPTIRWRLGWEEWGWEGIEQGIWEGLGWEGWAWEVV